MGYVYFIKPAFKRGPVKIGFATDVAKRVAALQTSNFERLEWFAGTDELYRRILGISGIHQPLGKLKSSPHGWVWSLRNWGGLPVEPF